ncbi:hypothetical protein [Paenibacillus faecalis]|uniref:hypothetical protein n=1 Tax=Paenibacillus faecalis TaxID=2079532 RepID=UPI000D1008C6|nr:hypothetical protein [Paenibacillus faecalis]
MNHRAAFPSAPSYEIESIENEMLLLGAKCVLLTVSSENVEQRMQSRNPHEWRSKSENEVRKSAEEFIQTQSELRKQSNLSILPTIEINTDQKDWIAYANQIMDFIG